MNQLFYSFGKFLLSNKTDLNEKKKQELLKKFTDIIEEKFARIEEKSSVVQNENHLWKERLFLKLIFSFLSTIENKIPELKETNRIVETNLFNLAKTRFKCLNSSTQTTDCLLRSPILIDYGLLLSHILQPKRDFH